MDDALPRTDVRLRRGGHWRGQPVDAIALLAAFSASILDWLRRSNQSRHEILANRALNRMIGLLSARAVRCAPPVLLVAASGDHPFAAVDGGERGGCGASAPGYSFVIRCIVSIIASSAVLFL